MSELANTDEDEELEPWVPAAANVAYNFSTVRMENP